MRSFIVMAMFTASLAHAGWLEYEEERKLELETDGLSELYIDAGAGSMTVDGDPGADRILVVATIQVDNRNADKAREIIEKRMTLSLDRSGDKATLRSYFESGMWGNDSGAIKLEVTMPQGIALRVDDSSGSIVIRDVMADVRVDDSSGSLKIFNAGSIDIDDGSGSIEIGGADGDVTIVDGSGSVTVSEVNGSVTVDDGSGSIRIRDVERDVIIKDDGSGGLSVSDVRGKVEGDI